MTSVPRLSLCHRIWFATTFVGYVGFLLLMPPFQTNDEPSQWHRVWSVAAGHLTCGSIPSSVDDLPIALDYQAVRQNDKPYRFGNVDTARLLRGHNKNVIATGNACVYIPVAYVLPALAMLPFVNAYDPRDPSGMLAAYYAARSVNLVLLAAGVLVFLWLAPALRNLTLLLWSLPMTMQQGTAINQESAILICGFALLLSWWSRSSRRQIIAMALFITLLAMMKSIYLVLLLLYACALWRLRAAKPEGSTRRIAALASLAAIPVVIQLVWTKLVVATSGSNYLPAWSNPSAQVGYLAHHPLQLPLVLWRQFLDLFGRGHMNGGWISVYGVLGWADFELRPNVYYWLLLGTALAFFADVRSARPMPEFGGVTLGGRAGLFVERVLPLVSFALIVPAVTMAMYMVFSAPGAKYAMGVQGRYLQLPYFAMLMLAVMWLRNDARVRAALERLGWFDERLVAWACMVMSWIGTHDAFRAVIVKYYSS
jgi:hypothetical protein